MNEQQLLSQYEELKTSVLAETKDPKIIELIKLADNIIGEYEEEMGNLHSHLEDCRNCRGY